MGWENEGRRSLRSSKFGGLRDEGESMLKLGVAGRQALQKSYGSGTRVWFSL